jgi:hypothetical protein
MAAGDGQGVVTQAFRDVLASGAKILLHPVGMAVPASSLE